MRKLIQLGLVTMMTVFMCSFSQPEAQVVSVEELMEPIELVEETVEVEMDKILAPAETFTVEVRTTVLEKAEEPIMSEEDIELIALVTMAEAEGESEYGKRLVIDTILNRVDTSHLGSETVSEVIYHPGQFTSMWNGRVDRCYVSEDICQLVREELESRTNSDTIYFHAGKYSKYGTPLFSEGNHYFSSI